MSKAQISMRIYDENLPESAELALFQLAISSFATNRQTDKKDSADV